MVDPAPFVLVLLLVVVSVVTGLVVALHSGRARPLLVGSGVAAAIAGVVVALVYFSPDEQSRHRGNHLKDQIADAMGLSLTRSSGGQQECDTGRGIAWVAYGEVAGVRTDGLDDHALAVLRERGYEVRTQTSTGYPRRSVLGRRAAASVRVDIEADLVSVRATTGCVDLYRTR